MYSRYQSAEITSGALNVQQQDLPFPPYSLLAEAQDLLGGRKTSPIFRHNLSSLGKERGIAASKLAHNGVLLWRIPKKPGTQAAELLSGRCSTS